MSRPQTCEDAEIPLADGLTLRGTLQRPAADASAPGALLVNGSGPLDRDSNMPGQRLDIAPAIARTLADRGIASLRYDKRGTGSSGGNYLTTGFHTETADAARALAALAKADGIDPTRLLAIGHSVGATIAIRLASTTPTLAGLILLSAPTRPGLDVMRWQADRIIDTTAGPLARQLRPLRRWRGRRLHRRILESTTDTIRVRGQGELPARWLREYATHDPRPDLPRITCPILAITGQEDIQVDPADTQLIGRLAPGPVTIHTPPGLTHLLRTWPAPAGISSYPRQLLMPTDPDLIGTISDWAVDHAHTKAA